LDWRKSKVGRRKASMLSEIQEPTNVVIEEMRIGQQSAVKFDQLLGLDSFEPTSGDRHGRGQQLMPGSIAWH
jgi:hypothetical protein